MPPVRVPPFDVLPRTVQLDLCACNMKNLIGSYHVYAISAGIGSGWGTFEGAVDNISYRFGNGPIVTTNFEVVPEPTTMALFGLGLLGAAGGLLRRRSA